MKKDALSKRWGRFCKRGVCAPERVEECTWAAVESGKKLPVEWCTKKEREEPSLQRSR